MNNDKTTTTHLTTEETPTITRRIGSTTFKVHVHFSETSKETVKDKMLRLVRNDTRLADMPQESCSGGHGFGCDRRFFVTLL